MDSFLVSNDRMYTAPSDTTKKATSPRSITKPKRKTPSSRKVPAEVIVTFSKDRVSSQEPVKGSTFARVPDRYRFQDNAWLSFRDRSSNQDVDSDTDTDCDSTESLFRRSPIILHRSVSAETDCLSITNSRDDTSNFSTSPGPLSSSSSSSPVFIDEQLSDFLNGALLAESQEAPSCSRFDVIHSLDVPMNASFYPSVVHQKTDLSSSPDIVFEIPLNLSLPPSKCFGQTDDFSFSNQLLGLTSNFSGEEEDIFF
eukprot:TRINITY_DN2461_c0_g1::TRINITY_DN2461_c0_g1_i1::g.8708::m.8708 TRINITY_DN2461_c0_g1::TRINITY_DN2461_c0_g1_i1::g.8708  ORF type:complete len:255 (-),score=17.08 TRINITY_DN2461_c0_g1_i1:504-1268(-)